MIYYAALLPRRGPHIASHYVCLSVRLSVCLSVRPVIVTERHVTPPSELQWHTCTLRHAPRAAYRTAISAAQACFFWRTFYLRHSLTKDIFRRLPSSMRYLDVFHCLAFKKDVFHRLYSKRLYSLSSSLRYLERTPASLTPGSKLIFSTNPFSCRLLASTGLASPSTTVSLIVHARRFCFSFLLRL